MFGSLHLPGLALRGVLHLEDGLLPEGRVVVKAQLSVGSVNLIRLHMGSFKIAR